ncbi:response regulator [Neptuniibacter sp.]|uniref:response regulator n=1 Tax=Neptuniibacter sp. TaxID=1962643 RepID=UPI00262C2679|nr:response regulator [Neptuniibacter sp.]
MSQPVPVVICDDSRMARKQMAAALRGWNVEVTFAEHGLEGLEAVRAGKGDILFLDLTMPIMDGYQALERIRRDDLPTMVIVVSGDIQPEARTRVLELGALDFIQKPTSPEVIAESLNRFGLLSELEHPESQAPSENEVLELPDYYQEISNVAMGQAGDMLARLLNTFVHLSIPSVNVVAPSELERILLAASDRDFDMISQGFVGPGVAGEALLVFRHSNLDQIAQLMGHHEETEHQEAELLMSLSNAMIGAFIQGFSKQTDMEFSCATPQIIRNFKGLPELNKNWDKTLMITIGYQLKEQNIHCDLMMVFTEDSLPKLKKLTSYF